MKEKKFYEQIGRLFVTFQSQNFKYLVIEYIEGNLLVNINKLLLQDLEKIKLILEIIITIEYLHSKKKLDIGTTFSLIHIEILHS